MILKKINVTLHVALGYDSLRINHADCNEKAELH